MILKLKKNDPDFFKVFNSFNNKEILETKDSTTPIVPVYSAEIPAEDTVFSDNFEQGDSVVHAKYGNGVVENLRIRKLTPKECFRLMGFDDGPSPYGCFLPYQSWYSDRILHIPR